MIEPFEDAAVHQHARLDHVFTQLQREVDGPYLPICYRRLLLGGSFPDGTFALISVVDRHHGIEIAGLDPARSDEMPSEVVMPANPLRLKFEQKV